jgi:hypothetical protein
MDYAINGDFSNHLKLNSKYQYSKSFIEVLPEK